MEEEEVSRKSRMVVGKGENMKRRRRREIRGLKEERGVRRRWIR